jgi:Homeodomain-like domain
MAASLQQMPEQLRTFISMPGASKHFQPFLYGVISIIVTGRNPQYHVQLNMSESNNGESLPRAHRLNPKRHNAKLCPFAIRQRIVNALANGDSIRAIARALHVSNNTVVAIREQDWQQVEARKARLAAQWEQVSTKAVDQLNDHLDASTLPPNVLVPIAGVATDKVIALRGDSALTVRHEHSHRLTDEDIVAFAIHRTKLAKAAQVIDTPSDASHLSTPAPNTAPPLP